jgi:hypothetical protein
MGCSLYKFLVERRNAKVKRSLQLEYNGKVLNQDLQVFCVSNKEYLKYLYEEQTMALPRIKLSGILELRQFCQLIPAAVQFEAVVNFFNHQVPSFLSSIQQWLLQGSDGLTAERADSLRKALESSKGHISQVCLLYSTLYLCSLGSGLFLYLRLKKISNVI